MLNPFPIQFLSLLAHAILRVVTGLLLVYLGVKHFRMREVLRPSFPFRFGVMCFAFLELATGAMFILGWYTQIAALLSLALSLKVFAFHKRFTYSVPAIPGRLFYLLLAAVSISLFITGAGFFAFDMPL